MAVLWIIAGVVGAGLLVLAAYGYNCMIRSWEARYPQGPPNLLFMVKEHVSLPLAGVARRPPLQQGTGWTQAGSLAYVLALGTWVGGGGVGAYFLYAPLHQRYNHTLAVNVGIGAVDGLLTTLMAAVAALVFYLFTISLAAWLWGDPVGDVGY